MKRKAWQKTVLDKNVTRRFKKLGDLGESLAETLLGEKGFKQIVNLNKEKRNTKFFDLIAKRGNQAFAISVKARNKFENSVAGKKLNSRYKLTSDPKQFEAEAREVYQSLSAWVAISLDFDRGLFDAYFGLLSDLEGNRKGIVMSPQATERYEILAKLKKFDETDVSAEEMQSLKNRYKRR